jgi:hypothetical protein
MISDSPLSDHISDISDDYEESETPRRTRGNPASSTTQVKEFVMVVHYRQLQPSHADNYWEQKAALPLGL